MPKDEPIDSRNVPRSYTLFRGRAKGKQLEIRVNDDQDGVLFWDNRPCAILSGGCCYYLDFKWPGAATKAIHAFGQHAIQIRSAASDFDFVMGSLLTKAGLPLTRRS